MESHVTFTVAGWGASLQRYESLLRKKNKKYSSLACPSVSQFYISSFAHTSHLISIQEWLNYYPQGGILVTQVSDGYHDSFGSFRKIFLRSTWKAYPFSCAATVTPPSHQHQFLTKGGSLVWVDLPDTQRWYQQLLGQKVQQKTDLRNAGKAQSPGIHIHHPGSQADHLKEYSPLELLIVKPFTKRQCRLYGSKTIQKIRGPQV